jgi:uncharacterized membrane protein YagU involved in acid resistance
MSDNASTYSNNAASLPPPSALESILLGGLVVGVLDILDAITFSAIRSGTRPATVLQSVAAGLLGREAAFNGGAKTAALGLALHFLNATLFAIAYYFISRFFPAINRHAIIAGLLYGVAAHLVMQYIVLPNSALGPRTRPAPFIVHVNGYVGHALLVGLPIALISRWSAKRQLAKNSGLRSQGIRN